MTLREAARQLSDDFCDPAQEPPAVTGNHVLTCGGLRPYVDAGVVPAQQVLNESGLPCAVLPQQEHAGLGLKVRFRQQ